MENAIFGLTYRFADDYERHLIFEREIALTSDDLAALDRNMLENGGISGVIPLEIQEIDLRIKLGYPLSGFKPLSEALAADAFTMRDFYLALHAIVSVIRNGKAYMLNEKRYILDKELIFVGSRYSDIHLVYLPVKQLVRKLPLPEELRRLAAVLFSHVSGRKEPFWQEWMRPGSAFDLHELNQQLETVLSTGASEGSAGVEPDFADKPNRSTRWRFLSFRFHFKHAAGLGFILLLVVTAIWSARSAVSGALNICLGLILLYADILYLLSKKGMTAWLPRPVQPAYPAVQPDIKEYYSSLSRQTTLLPPPENTGYLQDPAPTIQLARPAKPVLSIVTSDSNECVPIAGDSFLIGRDPSAVHMIIKESGISRKHAEIIRRGADCFLRDLGSTNGTHLNDELLESFQEYPMKEGDRIRLIDTEIVFSFTDKLHLPVP